VKGSTSESISIYGKRWDIEVFFKACKSYLRLVKEYRGISYDAIGAYVSIVFAHRYAEISKAANKRFLDSTQNIIL